MRVPILALSLLALLLAGRPAGADQTDGRLDPLFVALRGASSVAEAEHVEGRIWAIWLEITDSASARLLRQGTDAMNRRLFPIALVSFNRLIARAPGFAEAWNKRATLYYLMGDYAASIVDIEETLRLEPRHFGALSGLGLIMLQLDRPEVALRSFEAVLQLHPLQPGARAQVEALRRRIEGRPI